MVLTPIVKKHHYPSSKYKGELIMRVVVHDVFGFSFPVQLSRELALRGHEVLHLYSDFEPRGGRLSKENGDPPPFNVELVSIGEAYQKYNLLKRLRQEIKYGKIAFKRIEKFNPSILFNCNSPIAVCRKLQKGAQSLNIRYVNWTQDLHSLAVREILTKKFGIFGILPALYIQMGEKRVINNADATIVISDDFIKEFEKLNIAPKKVYSILNWMPLDEMKPECKINTWSISNGLDKTLNIIYVGMLSFKHDYDVFVRMSRHFSNQENIRIVLVGAGIMFERLKKIKISEGLDNLILIGWQKYDDISFILATGDILMAACTAEASNFSYPSKVLSYLCAKRAVLAVIPKENIISKILIQYNLGLVANPNDISEVLNICSKLIFSKILREELAENGRRYAENNFDIRKIADKFEKIIKDIY